MTVSLSIENHPIKDTRPPLERPCRMKLRGVSPFCGSLLSLSDIAELEYLNLFDSSWQTLFSIPLRRSRSDPLGFRRWGNLTHSPACIRVIWPWRVRYSHRGFVGYGEVTVARAFPFRLNLERCPTSPASRSWKTKFTRKSGNSTRG
jgi:hypothetical protein